MADSRMRGRVKGLFTQPPPDGAPPDLMPDHPVSAPPESDAQRQALQVLVLAQRTADDHVATAQRQADGIRADARATAEQIARHAQAQADGARRDAGKALADARATAEQMVRDAQAHAEDTRRDAEQILAEAQARAEQIADQAQAAADDLEREAQQRYDEAVGGLAAQREALQQQIEALQRFDREYRARLRTFMQSQLHALGDDDGAPEPEPAQPEKPSRRTAAKVATER